MSTQDNIVSMGYVRSAVGVKGWVKLKVDTETQDSLLSYADWWLSKQDDWQLFRIENSRINAQGLQVKFVGIDNRDAAEQLRGMTIGIKREDFAQAGDNEYYWTDLVGMAVYTPEEEKLGEVNSLMESGAHDILVVHLENREILIPFVEHFILDVDLEKRRITADWQADYAC